ncbi:Phage tail collar domain-containing protein [Azospirillaceae bacterium]|nr:hypothetical protein MTCCP1_00049 [uncultured bacterium]
MSDPYIGEIRPFALQFTPRGWLVCNGDRAPIAQYQVLFAVIRDYYGPTDSRTYFTLPNFQGSATAHWGTPPVSGWPYTQPKIGGRYGADGVTATLTNFPPHTHTVSLGVAKPTVPMAAMPGSTDFPSRPFNTAAIKLYNAWSTATPNINSIMSPSTIGPSGVASPAIHENRQPFQAFRFCICHDGLYPSPD